MIIIGADAKGYDVVVLVDVEVEFPKTSKTFEVPAEVAASEAFKVPEDAVASEAFEVERVTAAVLTTLLRVVTPPGEAVMVPIVV